MDDVADRVGAGRDIGEEFALVLIFAGGEIPLELDFPTLRGAGGRRREVKELPLFGSAMHGELRQDSDLDFLVDFLPGAWPGLLGLSAMARELAALLGRKVDLAVKPALKPRIRSGVLAEARLIYAA